MSKSGSPVAIVMAAGKSTRMKSELPKVLHELCGQPLLAYVLDALHQAGIVRKLVVVGFGSDQVRRRFADYPGVEFVEQTEQKGTGHAAGVCRPALAGYSGPVVVLAGDGPFVRPAMIAQMLEHTASAGAKAFIASARVKDPTGLGRIVRDANGKFARIVEHKDASDDERRICEINPSFYVFDAESLFAALDEVRTDNAQGEYYITDVPGILLAHGQTVMAETLADETDMFGINHRRHLAEAHALMQGRIQDRLMDSGVTIVDPRNTYIGAGVEIGVDSIIEPFSILHGPSQIGPRSRIGPFVLLPAGTELAADSRVSPNAIGPAAS